jgi:O-acetyl-ADP-ribose deacetylase (regulator of RNase III)
MIEFRKGDILKDDAEALVNTVNCVGVMGRGIALQFKRAFPTNYKVYQSACRRGDVQPGRMLVVETNRLTNPRYIINFPTKRHWRGKSRMADIVSGLDALVAVIRDRGIRSVSLPPLGSGLGGLDWRDVKPRIESAMARLEGVQIRVYEPQSADRLPALPNGKVPSMTAGRAALVSLMHAYLKALMDPVVALLEVHKLMYFMQEAGEPLRLVYAKAPYGPYAENLRHVLQAVEGYYVSGYSGADSPTTELRLVPGAVEEATAAIRENSTTRRRLERVVDVVDGFETPHGLELLSTVHWVVTREHPASRGDVVALVHSWNARKSRFTPAQIDLAVNTLLTKGWISPLPN